MLTILNGNETGSVRSLSTGTIILYKPR